VTERISTWLDQLAAIVTALGALKPGLVRPVRRIDRGELRSFCADRGIDTRRLAGRSTG
jgi:isopentenyl-diphosphate delta-isomerase